MTDQRCELTDFPVGFFTRGGEPVPLEATTLLCGATKAELAAWKRDRRDPVREFLPDASPDTVGDPSGTDTRAAEAGQ